jgi:REP element-mobilizing transposase RayT
MLQEGFFDSDKETVIRWGDLPHWRQDGALYFVTFRLADSLPGPLLNRWRRQKAIWLKLHPNPTPAHMRDFTRMFGRRMERWLDRGSGSCLLREPLAKQIIQEALDHFAGERYELGESAVAGNHVHVTLRTLPGVDLSDVLQSVKRYTSRQIRYLFDCQKRYPDLAKELWQHESFDHIVRSQAHLDRFHRYIRNHDR